MILNAAFLCLALASAVVLVLGGCEGSCVEPTACPIDARIPREKIHSMEPQFTGISFFVYPVVEMARARAFYGGVLRLKETLVRGNEYVEFGVGSETIALSAVLKNCVPGTSGAAALETGDFEAVIARLRLHRVKFLFGPLNTGDCHFARFLDTEGNHLCVHSRLAR